MLVTFAFDDSGFMPTSTLFRSQAIAHQAGQSFGSVLNIPALFTWRIALIPVLLLAAAMFVFTGPSIARRTNANGIVLPSSGLVHVRSAQAGLVVRVQVKEGEQVEQGQLLLVLNADRDTSSTTSLARISGYIRNKEASLEGERSILSAQINDRKSQLRQKQSDQRAELTNLEQQIALQEQRLALVKRKKNRIKELVNSSFVSAAQLEEREFEEIAQMQTLAELRRQQITVRHSLATTASELRALHLDHQRGDKRLSRDAADIKRELAESENRREIRIVAPRAGVVSALMVLPSQMVNSSTSLAIVSPPDGHGEAELYVPLGSAGFVKPGQSVQLRLHAYPYQKFGHMEANITHVSPVPLSAEELSQTSPMKLENDMRLRVKVKLSRNFIRAYGKNIPMRPGLTFDAAIELEKRKLYEWVLDPLYTITGRM